MKMNNKSTLIAIIITIIILLSIVGIILYVMINGNELQKIEPGTQKYTIEEIQKRAQQDMEALKKAINKIENRIANLDDVEKNYKAKQYFYEKQDDKFKVEYQKEYVVTINENLEITNVEPGKVNKISKTVGIYEITKVDGEDLTLAITIENEDGLENIEFPDAIDEKIIFDKEVTKFQKDIKLKNEQTYKVKIKAKGEEELEYTLVPIKEFPTINITKEEDKSTKLEMNHIENKDVYNYYTIDDGVSWLTYEEPIELTTNGIMYTENKVIDKLSIEKKQEKRKRKFVFEENNDSLIKVAEMVNNTGYLDGNLTGKIEEQEEEKYYSLNTIFYNGDLVLDGQNQVEGATLYSNIYEFGNAGSDAGTASVDARNMVVLKVNGNLTINSGVTLTACRNGVYGGPKGLLVYCTGTLTNNGDISMTGRGARAAGENVYLWKNSDSSYEYVPAVGSPGGRRRLLCCLLGS